MRPHIPVHTKEELNDVAIAARDGDVAARAELITMMRPYVVSIIRKIGGDYRMEQRYEMEQAGYIGVLTAMHRYEEDKGVKFNTYAYYWIRHEVMEWLAKNSGVLPMSRKAWNMAGRLEEVFYEDEDNASLTPSQVHDEDLASLEIEVKRKGEPTSISVPSAGDIFRARQQPWLLSDHKERSVQSAEEDYFNHTDVVEDMDAIRIIRMFQDSLHELHEEEWLSAAESLCEEHGWAPEAAKVIIEEVQP